jgi:hypothetical protein
MMPSRPAICWGGSPHSGQTAKYAATAGLNRSWQLGQQTCVCRWWVITNPLPMIYERSRVYAQTNSDSKRARRTGSKRAGTATRSSRYSGLRLAGLKFRRRRQADQAIRRRGASAVPNAGARGVAAGGLADEDAHQFARAASAQLLAPRELQQQRRKRDEHGERRLLLHGAVPARHPTRLEHAAESSPHYSSGRLPDGHRIVVDQAA